MSGSNFIVRGGGDFSGISKGLKSTQSELSQFKNQAERTSHGISQTLGGVVDGLGLSFIKLGKVAAAAAVTKGIVELGKKARITPAHAGNSPSFFQNTGRYKT